MAKKKSAARKPAAKKQLKKTKRKTTRKPDKKKNIGLFHFRRYKKEEGKNKRKHPKLIVGADKNNYEFMGLTEDKKKGHRSNIKLDVNPKIIGPKGKRDPREAHIRKEVRTDKKTMFGEPLTNYSLVNSDKKKVQDYLNKRKKR